MKDFFISYNKKDKEKAKWVGGCLEQHGYSVVIQAWDFRIGNNFVIEMQRAINEAERVITILSKSYISSPYCQAEWASTFAKDPTGEKNLLIPIRVEDVSLTGFFNTSIYIDLFNIDEATAKKRLLQAVDKNDNPRKPPEFSKAFSNREGISVTEASSTYIKKDKLTELDIKSLPKPLSKELESHYFSRLAQGDATAEEVLIQSNLRLVFHITQKFWGQYNYSHEHLFLTGKRGLIKAISTFDNQKNIRFGTYAARCIENEILMAIHERYREGTADGLELEVLEDVLDINNLYLKKMDKKDFYALVLKYINHKMDDIEKSIIKYRYGFCGEAKTQREVANLLGLSISYVSRVEKRALLKLQHYFDTEYSLEQNS